MLEDEFKASIFVVCADEIWRARTELGIVGATDKFELRLLEGLNV